MSDETWERLEQAADQAGKAEYVLRLYITGAAPSSSRAVRNLRVLCETYLRGRYRLEVVDVYQQPGLAEEQQIVATPTLVKELPLPLCRLVGDLSDTDSVLKGLGLRPRS